MQIIFLLLSSSIQLRVDEAPIVAGDICGHRQRCHSGAVASIFGSASGSLRIPLHSSLLNGRPFACCEPIRWCLSRDTHRLFAPGTGTLGVFTLFNLIDKFVFFFNFLLLILNNGSNQRSLAIRILLHLHSCRRCQIHINPVNMSITRSRVTRKESRANDNHKISKTRQPHNNSTLVTAVSRP